MIEEFRDLDKYYAVSNIGRVKSKRSGKILKPHLDSKRKGYKYITLNYDGVKKSYQILRNCCNHKVCKDTNGYSYVSKTAGGFKFSWKE